MEQEGRGNTNSNVIGRFSQNSDLENSNKLTGGRHSTKNGKCFNSRSYALSYTCDICQFVTACKKTLLNHMYTHTGEKPYKCQECDTCFANEGTLYRHQQRHTKLKSLICGDCGKRFYSNGDLKRHIKSHLGIKEFMCDHCGFQFTRKSSLKNHIFRVHGIEKYVYKKNKVKKVCCKICGVMFHSCYMKTHMRRHTGEKPYHCPHCPSKFGDNSTLFTHLKMHTNSGQFFCRSCNLVFDSRKELNIHYRTKHQKNDRDNATSEYNSGKLQSKHFDKSFEYISFNKKIKKKFSHTVAREDVDYIPSPNSNRKPNGEVASRSLRTRHCRVSYNEGQDELPEEYPLKKKKSEYPIACISATSDENLNIIPDDWQDSQNLVSDSVLEITVNSSQTIELKPARSHIPQKRYQSKGKIPNSCSDFLSYTRMEDSEIKEEINENGIDGCVAAGIKCESEVISNEYVGPDSEIVKIEKIDEDIEDVNDNVFIEENRKDKHISDYQGEKNVEDYFLDNDDILQLFEKENAFNEVYVTDKDIVSTLFCTN